MLLYFVFCCRTGGVIFIVWDITQHRSLCGSLASMFSGEQNGCCGAHLTLHRSSNWGTSCYWAYEACSRLASQRNHRHPKSQGSLNHKPSQIIELYIYIYVERERERESTLLLDFMFLQVMFPPMLNWYLGVCMDTLNGINPQYRYCYQRTYPTGIQIYDNY